MSNIQIMAKATVLDLPVDAAYQRKSDGSSDIIVYGRVDSPKWLTITELIGKLEALVTLGTSKDAITSALPDKLKEAIDSIKFRVVQVYFKKQTPATTADATPATADAKRGEYAFHIELDLGGITGGFPIEVQNVSFKIWQTANPMILEEMDITRINKLLGASS